MENAGTVMMASGITQAMPIFYSRYSELSLSTSVDELGRCLVTKQGYVVH